MVFGLGSGGGHLQQRVGKERIVCRFRFAIPGDVAFILFLLRVILHNCVFLFRCCCLRDSIEVSVPVSRV